MEFKYRNNYANLTDKQIVDKVLVPPHNEEGVAFLLYNRYDPLLHKVYKNLTKDGRWYDDCVGELFFHLKGKDSTWHVLASFEWRSTFGYWLEEVARNKFREVLPRLMGKVYPKVFIDEDNPEKPKIQIPDGGEEDYERRLRKVMLMEAIGKLNDDERFVILKRLQGYNSKEIAELLDKKWKMHNIVKYNNKGEIVISCVEYVDSKAQKARNRLKEIMNNNK